MKKLSLGLIVICFSSVLNAQITTLAAQYNAEVFMQHVDRIGSNNLDYLPDDYDGTPYANPIFLLGKIYEKNELIASNYALRYNAIVDEIEIKESLYTEDSEIMALTKTPDLHVRIMNDLFIFAPGNSVVENAGYFQVLYVGDNCNLYKKIIKKYFPPKKAETSFAQDVPAKFEDRSIYYLVTSDGNFKEFGSSKNKKINIFEKNQSEIKKYINKANLDINSEDDLIKIVRYYDTITDSAQ